MLEFKNEMLIPKLNGEIYYGVYELENWLKRICFTTYFLNYGPDWPNEISSELKEGLNGNKKQNEKMMHLGGRIGNNMIWSANLSQLIDLFENGKVREQVKNIIDISFDSFRNDLYKLKNIRNLLAHNLALSRKTKTIYQGVYESLQYVIKTFKKEYIYRTREIKDQDFSDEICKYFNEKMKDNDWSEFQAIITNEGKIYSIVCLPVERNGCFKNYIHTKKLIKTYSSEEKDIISFKINKTGDEYGILFTSKSDKNTIEDIIDLFVFDPNFWSGKPYHKQNPRYACYPKIWYYENGSPDFECPKIC